MAHPLAASENLWANPPAIHIESITIDGSISSLLALAAQGRWREVASYCHSKKPTNTDIKQSTIHIYALFKLKLYQEAAAALASLGPPTPAWPFLLRALRAELPERMGNSKATIDQLHLLLQDCATYNNSIWYEQWRAVAFALVGRYAAQMHYKAALSILNDVLIKQPKDAVVWSQVGRIQLLIGDIPAAETSFAQSASSSGAATTDDSATLAMMVEQDKALLQFCQHNYDQSISILENTAAAPEAVNNAAVSHLYSGRLATAISTLEAGFQQQPASMLDEPFVLNLASLYDLGGTAESDEAKIQLSEWVNAHGGMMSP